MGSPATSYLSCASIAAITWGVFFQRWPPATGAAHAVALHVPGEQLLAAAGYGTGVETEQISDPAVAAMAELEGLEAGVQAALAFVEQRAEQDDGGLQLIRHHAPACAERQAGRLRLPDVAGAHLSASHRAVGREVNPAPGDLGTPDASLAGQVAQRVLDLDLEQVLQLVGGVSGLTVADQHRTGVEQGAVSGEVGTVVRPQSELVETSDLSEGVVLAAVRVAGKIGERAQLAEDGHGDLGLEGSLEFDHGEDRAVAEQLAQARRMRGRRHVMITLHDGATITSGALDGKSQDRG